MSDFYFFIICSFCFFPVSFIPLLNELLEKTTTSLCDFLLSAAASLFTQLPALSIINLDLFNIFLQAAKEERIWVEKKYDDIVAVVATNDNVRAVF